MHSTFGAPHGRYHVNALFNRAGCCGRRRTPPKHDVCTVRRPVRAEVDRPGYRGQAQRLFLSYLFDVDAGSTADRHIRPGPGERDAVAVGRECRFVLAAGIGRQWDQREAAFGAGTAWRRTNSSIAATAITKLAMTSIHGRTRRPGCDGLGSEEGAVPAVTDRVTVGISTMPMKRYPRFARVSM